VPEFCIILLCHGKFDVAWAGERSTAPGMVEARCSSSTTQYRQIIRLVTKGRTEDLILHQGVFIIFAHPTSSTFDHITVPNNGKPQFSDLAAKHSKSAWFEPEDPHLQDDTGSPNGNYLCIGYN
jgi:hypothetical protein